MTILVSSVLSTIIVMLSDSVVTTTHFQEEGDFYNEYETGSKYYLFPGVGCITTWGNRTSNLLGQYLQKKSISPKNHSVRELAELTHKYVCDEYSKEDEIGFHIGGFDRAGKPCLFHVFWGNDRPQVAQQTEPTGHIYDHSDGVFLYNGRNDLANVVITVFKEQIDSKQEVRFDLTTPLGRISLCDFIARFASEITPQVGPPFVINLIFPDNSIEKIVNTAYSPISLQSIVSVIPRLSLLSTLRQTNEVTVLDNMPVNTSRIQPTGIPSIEPPHVETQAGTISYILHKRKDSG